MSGEYAGKRNRVTVMRAGVSTSSLFQREMNEDAVTILKGLGISCIEIFLTTYSEYTKEFAAVLRDRSEGMTVNSVHLLTTQFEPQLFGGHPRAREDAFKILRGAMASAQIFRAGNYTFHGLTRLKRNSSLPPLENMAAGLNAISDSCREYGVRLCLENVHWAMYSEPGLFRKLAPLCPDLAGVFDIKQARLSHYPYPMYLKDMEGRISHVHLTDVNDAGKICLPGKGNTDFAELIKRLKDIGFDGAMLIEVYPQDYGQYVELKQSCDFLEELIYKLC